MWEMQIKFVVCFRLWASVARPNPSCCRHLAVNQWIALLSFLVLTFCSFPSSSLLCAQSLNKNLLRQSN